MNREQILRDVQSAAVPYDVLIVGGGATGLGAAVDAAARGHRTVLIEQDDFAKGTSSRSTKLVHGGVRYLQQGNVKLVLEALHERGLLLRNAPHLVHEMSFVIPAYYWWQRSFYGIGMKVYDRLAGKLGMHPSEMLSRKQTVERLPNVEREGLRGGVSYSDGQFDDARLAINLAQTAHEHGAAMLNYVKCCGFVKSQGRIAGVMARDEETQETFEIRSRVVINATGIFADELIGFDTGEKSAVIAVSQGIHLVLPKDFLPGNTALMIPKTADGRVLFAVPWHDCVVVGTTDTPLKEKSLEPRALPEEREFVLSHACKYLEKDPRESDVLSIFAGLRPLVRKGDAKKTAKLSRDHTILESASGLLSVVGGKWTTYRRMAADAINHAETIGELTRRPCPTETLAIHGAQEPSAGAGDPTLAVYGSDAPAIEQLRAEIPDGAEPLHPLLPYCRAEVVWQAREEMARTVEDVLSRRTRSLILNARASIEAAPLVARLLAAEGGHDENWITAQVESFRAVARHYVFGNEAGEAARPETLPASP